MRNVNASGEVAGLEYLMRTPGKLFWTSLPLIVGLVVPSLILIAVETIAGRMPLGASLADVRSRQFAEGENVFLLSVIGLVPFTVLSMFSFFAARWLSPRRLACVALGGLLGILAYMVPAHVSIWYPLYAGGHNSSTAAIGFLFIPFLLRPSSGYGAARWLDSLTSAEHSCSIGCGSRITFCVAPWIEIF